MMFDLGNVLGDLSEDQEFSICLDGLEFDPLVDARENVQKVLGGYGCSQQCFGIAFQPSSVVPGGVGVSMAFKVSFKGLQSSAVLSFDSHYHPESAHTGVVTSWTLKSPSGGVLGKGPALGEVLQEWLVGVRSELLAIYKDLGERLGMSGPATNPKTGPAKTTNPKTPTSQKPTNPKTPTSQKPKAKKAK